MRRLAFVALVFLLLGSFSFMCGRYVERVRASSAILYDDVSDGYVDSDSRVYSIFPQMSLGDWNTNAYAACFVKFNLSGVSGTLSSAILNLYVARSLHDNITDADDPLTNIGLGDCQVIHITDYGTLDASDLFASSIGNDPGVLIGNSVTPNIGYVPIDVETAMQDDINNGRPWSTFMLKMSTNTDSDDRNDYWVFWTTEYGDINKQPYVEYELTPAPPTYQGDLILSGNNVTVIDGDFNFNGSIMVEENATLILRNGVVNFTQTRDRQFNVTLRNPLNGNPRLTASNMALTSKHELPLYLKQNSTTDISDSVLQKTSTFQHDNSIMNVHNSTIEYTLWSYVSSTINVLNSTIGSTMTYDSSTLSFSNSTVGSLNIAPYSVNCTISKLKPGLFSHWNFISNCTVDILPAGTVPNVTLIDTIVSSWRFGFYGASTATVADSTIGDFSAFGTTFLRVYDSSIMSGLYARHNAVILLINSTYHYISGIDDSATVRIAWHVNVHVVDSNADDVPSANVTVSYQNATLAESEMTGLDGWAKLALVERMMNDTGEYPTGNCTIKATYEDHLNSTTVNVTENMQIILSLPFVVPEFPSLLVLPLCMLTILVAALVYRRKHTV
jgi:hypothetical protein